MKFERARAQDISRIVEILREGRDFLWAQGVDQWQSEYFRPQAETESAISRGEQYLVRDGEEIAGVCTVVSHDADYDEIEESWQAGERYFAVHRVSIPQAYRGKGIAKIIYDSVVDMAKKLGVFALRADTHPDNLRMQRTFEKNGFVRVGNVRFSSGRVHFAYERNLKMEKKIVIASHNEGKLKEMREILSDWTVISAREAGYCEEVEETGTTFLENALIKAKAVSEALKLPALADDSGLCVDALDGAPGVFSARYSGGGSAENRALLLKNMAGKINRRAHFTCAVAVAFPDGNTVTAEGFTYGEILTEERGENGFGYDSLFLSDDLEKTFAEATNEEKNEVSHRGRALAKLVKLL